MGSLDLLLPTRRGLWQARLDLLPALSVADPEPAVQHGGACAWRGGRLGRRTLLLVDDVATAGATLDAWAGALGAAGSGPVVGLTVARVKL